MSPLLKIKTIKRREERLLRFETYYRQMRSGASWLAIIMAAAIAGAAYVARETGLAVDERGWLGLILLNVVFALWAFLSHLRLQHAESVRFHHERQIRDRCPRCRGELRGWDQSCMGCGWRPKMAA